MEAHVVLALKWLYKPAIPNDVMLGNRELVEIPYLVIFN